MPHFSHENLDVYRASMEFMALANELAEQMHRGRVHLGDQLRRAATSIPLNIAEGAGEYAAREKARFYRLAKRSATECAAVIDVCGRLELVQPKTSAAARDLLLRVVAMLTRMIRGRVGERAGTIPSTDRDTDRDADRDADATTETETETSAGWRPGEVPQVQPRTRDSPLPAP
jgi:four helix bundle protein